MRCYLLRCQVLYDSAARFGEVKITFNQMEGKWLFVSDSKMLLLINKMSQHHYLVFDVI